MKKVLVGVMAAAMIMVIAGCQQAVTRSLGGDMTVELEPDQKLEMITWKEEDLWYLTRPMRKDEEPEIHTFQQSTDFGIFEGTVTVIESRSEE